MTTKRADIFVPATWPRLLSREQAALYVGLSPNKFIEEVEAGTFPPAIRLLKATERALWDKQALDRAIDSASGAADDEDADYEARKKAWQRSQGRSNHAR